MKMRCQGVSESSRLTATRLARSPSVLRPCSHRRCGDQVSPPWTANSSPTTCPSRGSAAHLDDDVLRRSLGGPGDAGCS